MTASEEKSKPKEKGEDNWPGPRVGRGRTSGKKTKARAAKKADKRHVRRKKK